MVPEPTDDPTRRALLAVVAATTAGLAGCQTDRADGSEGRPSASEPPPQSDAGTTVRGTRDRPCDAGERERGSASISVDGAWSQFQADPGNTGVRADTAGPAEPSLAWRYATCAHLAEVPPVVDGGVVYLGGDRLRAFDADTGELLWAVDDRSSPTAPVVADDTLYFAGRELTAVDRADGRIVWQAQRESNILANGSPTLADGTLYVPGAVDDPAVRAFDPATGDQLWELDLDGEFGPRSPAVADGRVFVTDDGFRLVAVEPDGTDTQVIAGGADDAGVFSGPAVADGTVYVGGMEGRVRAFDAATGEQQWATEAGGGGVPGPPVVGAGRLFVVDSGTVHAFDTDGRPLWSRAGEGLGLGPADFGVPVCGADTLYVGGLARRETDDAEDWAGFVTALDVADGSEKWTYTTRGYVKEGGSAELRAGTSGPVAVADGAVFVATGAGDLYALG